MGSEDLSYVAEAERDAQCESPRPPQLRVTADNSAAEIEEISKQIEAKLFANPPDAEGARRLAFDLHLLNRVRTTARTKLLSC